MGCFRPFSDGTPNTRAPLLVMLKNQADPFTVAGKRRTMRGQHKIDVNIGQATQGIQVISERILIGLPGYVWRDLFENLITGE